VCSRTWRHQPRRPTRSPCKPDALPPEPNTPAPLKAQSTTKTRDLVEIWVDNDGFPSTPRHRALRRDGGGVGRTHAVDRHGRRGGDPVHRDPHHPRPHPRHRMATRYRQPGRPRRRLHHLQPMTGSRRSPRPCALMADVRNWRLAQRMRSQQTRREHRTGVLAAPEPNRCPFEGRVEAWKP